MYVTHNILHCSCMQLASKDIFKMQHRTGNGLICQLLGHALINLYNSMCSTKLDRDILHSMDCMDMKHFVKSYDPVQSANWEESPLLHYSFLHTRPITHTHTHFFTTITPAFQTYVRPRKTSKRRTVQLTSQSLRRLRSSGALRKWCALPACTSSRSTKRLPRHVHISLPPLFFLIALTHTRVRLTNTRFMQT